MECSFQASGPDDYTPCKIFQSERKKGGEEAGRRDSQSHFEVPIASLPQLFAHTRPDAMIDEFKEMTIERHDDFTRPLEGNRGGIDDDVE